MKYSGGLIKDTTQANYVIIGAIGLMVLVSIFLFSTTGTNRGDDPLDREAHPDLLQTR